MLYEKPRHFLNVKKSITGQAWLERLDQQGVNAALAMAQSHALPDIISRVLAGRGVEIDAAADFLSPTIKSLMPDPSTMTDMDKAAERLGKAIRDKQPVAIFGDYDVDGATSSSILYRFLRHFGVPCEIYIPDRIFEGYGPNPDAIEGLIKNGAGLIVTVDCGSTSFEALEKAKELGVDVVVFDHHQVNVELPHCYALVNPNRQDDLSGLGHLCAAGVVFMGVVATNRTLRGEGYPEGFSAPDLMQWLDLVALGTVCDVVPMVGLNRAFIVSGIKVLRQQKNAGLAELSKVSRMDGPAAPYHLGFLLGPRINAGGRIGDAALGAKLLTMDDQFEAQRIAAQLDQLNSERQAIEAEMLAEAGLVAEKEMDADVQPTTLVTVRENWHPGVVGLLASRLKDRFRLPTFAIALSQKNGEWIGTGSGRSISGVDLGAAVREAVALGILVKGGGHAMAAGITIEKSKLGEFRAFLEKHLKETVEKAQLSHAIKIDGAMTARSANEQFMEMIERAGPFGPGHSQPIFALPSHRVSFAARAGENHVRFTLSSGDGAKINGISFRTSDEPLGQALLKDDGKPKHFVGQFSFNYWQGRRTVQFRLMDSAELPMD
jgi:single-stranded-DNA-specific exonuclease